MTFREKPRKSDAEDRLAPRPLLLFMTPSRSELSSIAIALAVLGAGLTPSFAGQGSCHGNLIRMARQLDQLASELEDELGDRLDGSPFLRHLLRDADEMEDLAERIETMAEDGEADSHCFQNALGALHEEVHHLQDLLVQAGAGPFGRRGLDCLFGLTARIDEILLSMDRTVAQWDVEVQYPHGQSRYPQSRFGYNRPSIFDEDNPWTGTRRPGPAIRQVPVYRAIPVR
jgi:hypothetical protein